MNKSFFSLLLLCLSLNLFAALEMKSGIYTIDPAHTRVAFTIDHFVVSTVEGRFNDVKGEIVMAPELKDWKLTATVPISSLDTGVKKRDDHLKSADFFEVKKYPTMVFTSKKFEGSPEDFRVTGDLKIKDVTKEVVLNGRFRGNVVDSWKNVRGAFSANGKINRKDFHINYNDMIEAGPAVGDEVTIHLISEGILAQEKKK